MRRVMILVLMALAGWLCIAHEATVAQNRERSRKTPPEKQSAPRRSDEHRQFMRAKLAASSQILEGLSIEDFALIEKGAKELQRMSAAEEWNVSNDPMYRQHSNQFRRVAEQLQKKAKEKDLDGAALAWVEGTLSCIECHKWVRAVLIAK